MIRSSPDMRIVVGRFLSTMAKIFLLGHCPGCVSLMSFMAQNSTPATGVTVSEFPKQTFGLFPLGTWSSGGPGYRQKPPIPVFVQPVSLTARTVAPWRSHCRGASSFCAHVRTFSIFRFFCTGNLVWKH